MPLRFAITSRPSRCEEDLHLLADKHARHTKQTASPKERPFLLWVESDAQANHYFDLPLKSVLFESHPLVNRQLGLGLRCTDSRTQIKIRPPKDLVSSRKARKQSLK